MNNKPIVYITQEEFERMYIDMISDKSFIQGIIERNSFSQWIKNDPADDPKIHIRTLEILKKKLLEFEMYELINELDNTIEEVNAQIQINDLK